MKNSETAKVLSQKALQAAEAKSALHLAIRIARTTPGMSLREIAFHTGMSHETVARICASVDEHPLTNHVNRTNP